MQLAYIFGKYPTFPGNNNFSGKKCLFSAKISDDLFFSHQLSFSNFHHLIDQKLRKQVLIPYFFSKKHLLFSKDTRKDVFSVEI